MQAPERGSAILSNQALNVSCRGAHPDREDTLRNLNPEKSRKPMENSWPATQKARDLCDETQPAQESSALRECILLLLLSCVTIGFSFLQPKTYLTLNHLITIVGLGK